LVVDEFDWGIDAVEASGADVLSDRATSRPRREWDANGPTKIDRRLGPPLGATGTESHHWQEAFSGWLGFLRSPILRGSWG